MLIPPRVPDLQRTHSGPAALQSSAAIEEGLVIRSQTLREQARIRGGREGERHTEDEKAKSRLGEQGIPERPAKPAILDQDEMQNPKPLDPGHTA